MKTKDIKQSTSCLSFEKLSTKYKSCRQTFYMEEWQSLCVISINYKKTCPFLFKLVISMTQQNACISNNTISFRSFNLDKPASFIFASFLIEFALQRGISSSFSSKNQQNTCKSFHTNIFRNFNLNKLQASINHHLHPLIYCPLLSSENASLKCLLGGPDGTNLSTLLLLTCIAHRIFCIYKKIPCYIEEPLIHLFMQYYNNFNQIFNSTAISLRKFKETYHENERYQTINILLILGKAYD